MIPPSSFRRLFISGKISPVAAELNYELNFHNSGDEPEELLYFFMIPDRATILGMELSSDSDMAKSSIVSTHVADQCSRYGARRGALTATLRLLPMGVWQLSLCALQPRQSAMIKIDIFAKMCSRNGGTEIAMPLTMPLVSVPHPDFFEAAKMVPANFCDHGYADIGIQLEVVNTWWQEQSPDPFGGWKLSSPGHSLWERWEDGVRMVGLDLEPEMSDREVVFHFHPAVLADVEGLLCEDGPIGWAHVFFAPGKDFFPPILAQNEIIFIYDDLPYSGRNFLKRGAEIIAAFLAELNVDDRVNLIMARTKKPLFSESRNASADVVAELRSSLDVAATAKEADFAFGIDIVTILEAAFSLPLASGYRRRIVFVSDCGFYAAPEVGKLIADHPGIPIYCCVVGYTPLWELARSLATASGGAVESFAHGEDVTTGVMRQYARLASESATLELFADGKQPLPLEGIIIPRSGDLCNVVIQSDLLLGKSALTYRWRCGGLKETGKISLQRKPLHDMFRMEAIRKGQFYRSQESWLSNSQHLAAKVFFCRLPEHAGMVFPPSLKRTVVAVPLPIDLEIPAEQVIALCDTLRASCGWGEER